MFLLSFFPSLVLSLSRVILVFWQFIYLYRSLYFISEIQVASTFRMRKILSDFLSNIFKEIRKLVVLFKIFFNLWRYFFSQALFLASLICYFSSEILTSHKMHLKDSVNLLGLNIKSAYCFLVYHI